VGQIRSKGLPDQRTLHSFILLRVIVGLVAVKWSDVSKLTGKLVLR